MPKYLVWQKREFMFYQEVEADSKEKAIDIAFKKATGNKTRTMPSMTTQ